MQKYYSHEIANFLRVGNHPRAKEILGEILTLALSASRSDSLTRGSPLARCSMTEKAYAMLLKARVRMDDRGDPYLPFDGRDLSGLHLMREYLTKRNIYSREKSSNSAAEEAGRAQVVQNFPGFSVPEDKTRLLLGQDYLSITDAVRLGVPPEALSKAIAKGKLFGVDPRGFDPLDIARALEEHRALH